MQQNATHATDLTPQQIQAIDLYSRGQSLRCIAETVGVSRETLWRWRQQPLFAVVSREARLEQRECMREQMSELIELSLETLTRELLKTRDPNQPNPVEAAMRLLEFVRGHGLLADATPVQQQMQQSLSHQKPAAISGE